MKPGEILVAEGDITLNAGADTVTLQVKNTGDRPIQVGSHYHFLRPIQPSTSSGKRRAGSA